MFSAGPSTSESTRIGQGFWGVGNIKKEWLMSGSCAAFLRNHFVLDRSPDIFLSTRASVSGRQGAGSIGGISAHVEQIVGAVA